VFAHFIACLCGDHGDVGAPGHLEQPAKLLVFQIVWSEREETKAVIGANSAGQFHNEDIGQHFAFWVDGWFVALS
jgi:hypothetical protein